MERRQNARLVAKTHDLLLPSSFSPVSSPTSSTGRLHGGEEPRAASWTLQHLLILSAGMACSNGDIHKKTNLPTKVKQNITETLNFLHTVLVPWHIFLPVHSSMLSYWSFGCCRIRLVTGLTLPDSHRFSSTSTHPILVKVTTHLTQFLRTSNAMGRQALPRCVLHAISIPLSTLNNLIRQFLFFTFLRGWNA